MNDIKLVLIHDSDIEGEASSPTMNGRKLTDLFRMSTMVWSNATTITPVLNQSAGGRSYRIFYKTSVISNMNFVDLLVSIDRMFQSQFPGEVFQISCAPLVQSETAAGILISNMELAFLNAPALVCLRLNYGGPARPIKPGPKPDSRNTRSSDEFSRRFGFSLDRDADDEDDSDDDDEYDDDDDDDDDADDIYRESVSFERSKHVKRDIKRHNIIIADKKHVRKDEKIIRDFLKTFIPGKAEWIKDYRNDVAKRWIQTFAIKEKEAERRKKEFRSNQKRTTVGKNRRTATSVASKLINRYSAFYDPNK